MRYHLRDRYFECGRFERRIKLVNWKRVEGAEIVTADVYNDCEPSRMTCLLQYRERKERRDRTGEVDAIEENVNAEEFGVLPTVQGLCLVPLENIVPMYQRSVNFRRPEKSKVQISRNSLGQTNLEQELQSPTPAISKCTQDEHFEVFKLFTALE